jgi:O-acetyl-ADP-ribose deacetylase (regulator of RNase III)
MELWAAEGVGRGILLCLDLPTLEAALQFVRSSPELGGYLSDAALWTLLSRLHLGGPRSVELAAEETAEELQLQINTRPQAQDASNRTSAERPNCLELQQFLQSLGDRRRFHEAVTVVQGDLQHVLDVAGRPLDGIVFPTNPHLTNHFVGAAAAVFRRAGPGLEQFVSGPASRGARPISSAVVTPAFDAGVDRLVHCVGPSISMLHCYELLDATYRNALGAVQHEGLHCVAMASVSTGSLGVSPELGGQVAMRAVQKFLVRSNWEGKIAFVCKEERVLKAFTDANNAVMGEFNVVPPLPDDEARGRWMD